MSDLIVVAIPSEEDYVWKLSSEKIPHLTLLYLGKQEFGEKRQRMIDFVEHAATTSLQPFGIRVDERGTLGDKEADVLFFDKKSADKVADFRAFLLAANPEIASAYLFTDQYPEWLPHLTLGYPNAPAKPDKREFPGINWVQFDRIALWDGNYEGPTVKLKDNRHWEEVSMSDIAHFGVKGMKWGVRNSTSGRPTSPGSPSEDHRQASSARTKTGTKGLHSLSNHELQTMITRMNLEQQYSRLATSNSTTEKGLKTAKNILATGKTINELIAFVNSPVGKLIKLGLKKKFGRK